MFLAFVLASAAMYGLAASHSATADVALAMFFVLATLCIASIVDNYERLQNKEYVALKCGHHTRRNGEIIAFGHTITTKMPLNKLNGVDWCLACIQTMAIRCAWCSEPIFIGDPVTLYTPRKHVTIPEHAVIFNNDPVQLVGCLRWDCASTGADRAGFWLPGNDGKGKVHRVPSPIEIAMGTGKGVVVGDLSSPAEAQNPELVEPIVLGGGKGQPSG